MTDEMFLLLKRQRPDEQNELSAIFLPGLLSMLLLLISNTQ